MTSLSFILIVVITFLIGYLLKSQDKFTNLKCSKYYIFAGVLFGVMAFLLLYKLDLVPFGLHVDEAGMAFDAINISKYGVDRFLYHNPVYFINFGGGQNALYTYLAALMIKLWGYSIYVIRMPAVLLSLLALLAFANIMRKEKGDWASLILMFLFCVLPFSIMHSRWSLESYLLFPMLILAITFLYYALLKNKKIYYILSGLLFGLTLYTYAVSYLILPIFLAILFLYLLIIKKVKISEVLCFGIPLVILAIPLILMLCVNNGFISEIRTSWFSIPELFQYRGSEFSLKNIIANLNIFKVLFVSDGLIYNSFTQYGTMYYFSIPLIIYGLGISIYQSYKTLKEKNISLDLIMVLLFLVVLMVCMIMESPNINRANAIFIPFIYFLVLGIYSLVKKSKWVGIFIGLCYIVSFGSFINYYFNVYPEVVHNSNYFITQSDVEEALAFVSDKSSAKIYVIDNQVNQPYIYTLLALEVDAYDFNQNKVMAGSSVVSYANYHFVLDEEISTDNIYIFLKAEVIPDDINNYDFEIRNFGDITVYY